MDEKIRELLIELVLDWNGTGRNPCPYSGGQRLGLWKDIRLRKALTAIKKIFYEEMMERLPKEKKFNQDSVGMVEMILRQLDIGYNQCNEKTVKLLKEVCGVE